MKTLKNIRNNVRMYLDEESAADWTDAQIDAQINVSYLKVYKAVISTFDDYYSTTYPFNLTENIQEYALPSNFYKVQRLEVKLDADADDRRKVIKKNFDSLTTQLSSTTYDKSTPFYQIFGSYIVLLPVPSETVISGGLLRYVATVDDLDDDTDEINIPFADSNYDLIAVGAVSRLLKKGQQDMPSSRNFREEFDIGLIDLQNDLEDRYLDGPKEIVDIMGDDLNFSEH